MVSRRAERQGAANQKKLDVKEFSTTVPTSEVILDAAEALFAQKGFSAVSMRAIAAEAGQPLASANYYFGSKLRLFEAAFLRRIEPVNNRRIALLEERKANGIITLAEIVDAYIRPLFEQLDARQGGSAARLIMMFSKQVLSNPEESSYLQDVYDKVSRAFICAFQNSIPGLSIADAIWGYNYMVGVLVFSHAGKSNVARVPDDLVTELNPREPDEVTIFRLARFICAGIEALGTVREDCEDLTSHNPRNEATASFQGRSAGKRQSARRRSP